MFKKKRPGFVRYSKLKSIQACPVHLPLDVAVLGEELVERLDAGRGLEVSEHVEGLVSERLGDTCNQLESCQGKKEYL